ncbi:ubiquitin-like protein 3 [Aedes aegypti]|uniref:Ubiquitin-like domain-containing protein n=1 Tax=Aedes aegypti TaxID=7159 RepID=A0A1S4FN23_AEDAE|nr:ubiquitin-like protein 3 [Aedes aegypti]
MEGHLPGSMRGQLRSFAAYYRYKQLPATFLETASARGRRPKTGNGLRDVTLGLIGYPIAKINLRLILVSGKTKEFLFSPSDSAGDIALTVFENWPDDWETEAVAKAEILRLIYQGRFLHCNVTLGALGLPLGKTTVMHLVPRDNLPEPNSQDQRQKSKGGSSRCCSTSCCIL